MPQRICLIPRCGARLGPAAHSNRKYCSDACSMEAIRQSGARHRERLGYKPREAARGAGRQLVCAQEGCASIFTARNGAHHYCDSCAVVRNGAASEMRKRAMQSQRNAGRTCFACLGDIPLSTHGKRKYCNACLGGGQAKRDTLLRLTYGISLGAYEEMVAAGCAICATRENVPIRSMPVDHDHACCPGKKSCGNCVRGVLCHACNTAVGLMGDDVSRLRAAADYIDKHRQNREITNA